MAAARGMFAPAERTEEPDELEAPADAVSEFVSAEARAIELFNASEHAATVASVMHSLGAPYVHVGGGGDVGGMEVVVVWELCWYRYVVELDGGVVRQLGQGYELAELGEELPAANALLDDGGRVALAGR